MFSTVHVSKLGYFSSRFLVAIDRRNGAKAAMETVKLAEDFMLSSDGLVVGLDLSGDPMVSQFGTGRKLKPCEKKIIVLFIFCIISVKTPSTTLTSYSIKHQK